MHKKINLRKINLTDLKILFNWRNDDKTRRNSLNTKKIGLKEHTEYLKKLIRDPNKNQYILEINSNPVATLTELKLDNKKSQLSYNVDPEQRGKKIGQLLLNTYLSKRTGIFVCNIKNSNIPSIKMIEKIGFSLTRNNEDICIYELNKEN
tara:strand:- start:2104 stop:2553 length:450 start_codon:yes stop_codon:yes gene_type:complete